MKDKYAILAMLGIGTIVLLIYLLRRKAAVVLPIENAPANSTEAAPYPNAGPVNYGAISPGNSPINITINRTYDGVRPPTISVGTQGNGTGCGGCSAGCSGCSDSDCDKAGVPVTVNKVPETVLTNSANNFNGLKLKWT